MEMTFEPLKRDGARWQCTYHSGEDQCNHDASRLIDLESMKRYNQWGYANHITILRALCEDHITLVGMLTE